MHKVGDIPLQGKPRVWEACGCVFIAIKQHEKYDHLVRVIVESNCGKVIPASRETGWQEKDHRERKKGAHRTFKKERAVRWDPLADELMRAFG